MNRNILRHKLLRILSEKKIVNILPKGENIIGVSYEEIYDKLKVDEYTLHLFLCELLENKEVDLFDAYNIKGLYAKQEGVTSYSNKKYFKLYFKNIRDIIKDWTQIFIPLLSLIVAVFAVTMKNSEINAKVEKQENRIQQIEKQVNRIVLYKDSIQTNPKNQGIESAMNK